MADHGREPGNAHGIEVTVRYAAAVEPYREKNASASEVLSTLKANALAAFGLVEGAVTDGGTFTYKLFNKKDELTDLSRTLGDVAGQAHALELKVSQEVKQGSTDDSVATAP
jgi:hypothetical protein